MKIIEAFSYTNTKKGIHFFSYEEANLMNFLIKTKWEELLLSKAHGRKTILHELVSHSSEQTYTNVLLDQLFTNFFL